MQVPEDKSAANSDALSQEEEEHLEESIKENKELLKRLAKK